MMGDAPYEPDKQPAGDINHFLYVDDGDDVLYGDLKGDANPGKDKLYGSNGDDRLNGDP